MYEIEKKWTCNRKVAEDFILNLSKNSEIIKKDITQVYFHDQNAKVIFKKNKNLWKIKFLDENKIINIQVSQEEADLINKGLEQYDGNLVGKKGIATRIRRTIVNGVEDVLFTLKAPTELEHQDYEFEYSIPKEEFFDHFFENQVAKVVKTRNVFNWNNETVELDFFINSDHTYLEVEFKTMEALNDFIPNGLPIEKEGGLSNKKIALSHLEKKNDFKNKKNKLKI